MKEIVMPKLSDTMTEGRLVSWKKSVGETVRRGDIIAEVETDKANMELEAFANGVLLETRVQPGEMVAVGTVIGVIGSAGEKPAQGRPAPKEPPKQPQVQQRGAEQKPGGAAGASPTESAPEGVPAPEATNAPFAPEAAGAEQEKTAAATGEGAARPEAAKAPERKLPAAALERHEERAAPVVRRRARELGIDLSSVQGTGPEGRILLQDLERRAKGEGARQAAPQPAPPEPQQPREPQFRGPGQFEPLSRFRAAIARTVTDSWRDIPQFSASVEVLMDQVRGFRQDLKESEQEVSTNDVIVKAAALALVKFPRVNGSFAGDKLRLHQEINIGIVVGLSDALLIPVIKRCGELSLQEVAKESRRLVDRARAGQLTEEEMSGGTFTISNLGMYGVTRFNALIYPPQAAVLAVGAVVDRVDTRGGGNPVVSKVMEITLSSDHRILDGVYVAQFLAELKGILEHPARLLLQG